nr:hypothetical protein GCM10010200_042930 [Actinomadura rugatobispora]
MGQGPVFVRGADSVRALRADDDHVRWDRGTDSSRESLRPAGDRPHVPGRRELTSHDAVGSRGVSGSTCTTTIAVLTGRDGLRPGILQGRHKRPAVIVIVTSYVHRCVFRSFNAVGGNPIVRDGVPER